MDSSIILPFALWNDFHTKYRISSLCVTPNAKKIVTGSYTGQLFIWDLNLAAGQIIPINALLGHEHTITCLACTNEYVVSSCEGGQLCRWDLDDGYCSNRNKLQFVHRHLQLFTKSDQELLFSCGDYSEIFILHTFTLQVMYLLKQNDYNWLLNFHVIPSQSSDIILSVTSGGCVKFWLLSEMKNDSQYEIKSMNLVTEAIDVKFNWNQNEVLGVLIVSNQYWTLFNSELTNILYKIDIKEERLLGGEFLDNNVVIWTNSGKFYTFQNGNLINVISDDLEISTFSPAMTILSNGCYIRGDSRGKIHIWKDNKLIISSGVKSNFFNSFNNFVDNNVVTCCIFALEVDKFLIGCYNGSIIVFQGLQSVMSIYLNCATTKHNVLIGHNGRVNCLIYPYENYSYFNKAFVVSGGSDFSVCLWDVVTEELLYRFCVQGGAIIRLIVPPRECNTHVKYSICSISSDHSVAILNLRDKKCVILAARHTYPVVDVHWKPLDDFIIVECNNGTVYVWQMETGHLDRVLNGVEAQEVVYACYETCSDTIWNFYVNEKNTWNNMVKDNQPISLNNKHDLHILTCNLGKIVTKFSINNKDEILECVINQKFNLLTRVVNQDIQKNSLIFLDKIIQETETNSQKSSIDTKISSNGINELLINLIRFVLSSIHLWGHNENMDKLCTDLGLFKPRVIASVGIASLGAYSMFLSSTVQSSSLFAISCLAMIALSKVLEVHTVHCESKQHTKWNELASFYESTFVRSIKKPKVEILARAFRVGSVLKNILWKMISSRLQDPKEHVEVLKFWYKYLPHFKILDMTLSNKVDFENLELKTISLVLFGIAGTDLKFKACDIKCQENYVYQICASFVYLLFLPNEEKVRFAELQSIAIEFLGRGYIIWEQFLKMEEVIPILFQICTDNSKLSLRQEIATPSENCLNAQNALKAIAIARTAAFISCLMTEVSHIRSGQPKSGNFQIENIKPELLSILTFLLEKTPYIMQIYLNDVVALFVYCIDSSHLKLENLTILVPVLQKFRQVHHSVASQRIAVGLATGYLVLHDLKTNRFHEVSAHKDSISALKFSEDGKFLATYCCYENRITFWQVVTGIFGLGHLQLKRVESCDTYPIHDEEIRNHLEIGSLTWTDKRSVILRLCDGTVSKFHY